MIQLLSTLQLILYIGALSLIGQGILFIFAGNKRDTSLFYQLFQIINKPWTYIARLISPKMVAERHIPFVFFCVVAVFCLAITIAKVEHCISMGMVGYK